MAIKEALSRIRLRTGGMLALSLIITGSLVLSGCSKKEQETEKAASPAVQPVKEENQAKVHHDKGVQHTLRGEYAQAIAEYEKSLALSPESATTHNNLGFAYYDMGDMDKAIEHHNMALELNANLANVYYGLALAQERKGQNSEALANWKAFRERSEPHSKWWMKANEHIATLEKK